MSAQRRIVHFSGTVQGVGFRYTTVRVAGRYDVTGYVRNTPNGQVEVVVEGAADQVEAFLSDLGERMASYIRQTAQQLAEPTGQFDGFTVRF